MNVIVSGKNLEVSEGLKEYVEKKIGKLDRYLPTLTDARVEFALEKTKSASQRCQNGTKHCNKRPRFWQ